MRTNPSSWDVQHCARFSKQEKNKKKDKYEKQEVGLEKSFWGLVRKGRLSSLLGNSRKDFYILIYFTAMVTVLYFWLNVTCLNSFCLIPSSGELSRSQCTSSYAGIINPSSSHNSCKGTNPPSLGKSVHNKTLMILQMIR